MYRLKVKCNWNKSGFQYISDAHGKNILSKSGVTYKLNRIDMNDFIAIEEVSINVDKVFTEKEWRSK